jgi:hypothetical protein
MGGCSDKYYGKNHEYRNLIARARVVSRETVGKTVVKSGSIINRPKLSNNGDGLSMMELIGGTSCMEQYNANVQVNCVFTSLADLTAPTSSWSDVKPHRYSNSATLACSAADRNVNQDMHCKTSVLLQRAGRYLPADAKRFTPTPRVLKCQATHCCGNKFFSYSGA